MFLARKLEETQMGLYFIAVMVFFLLKIISDIGVDLAFVKQYPEQTAQNQSRLLRSTFVIRLISCTLVSFLYVLVENSGKVSFINDIAHVTGLTLTMYWMHSFRELLLRLLQAEKLFPVYAGVQVLAAILKALLVLTLLAFEDVTVKMVLIIEIIAFAASITYAAVRIREKLLTALRAKFAGGKQLLRFGYPLYMNAVLNLGNEKVSQYIVAGFGGPITMAFFGIAERLSDAGMRLFESFANVYYPSQTANFANDQKQKAIHMAEQSLMWVSFVIASAIVGFTILREPVMTIFFSEKYLSASNGAVIAAGMKFLPVRVSMISSVVNITVCFLMFKLYGYQGAIAALLLTQLLMNFLYHFWLGKAGFVLSINPVITICSICIISVALAYWCVDHFLLSLFIFPFYVTISLWALPVLRRDLFDFVGKAATLVQNRISSGHTGKA